MTTPKPESPREMEMMKKKLKIAEEVIENLEIECRSHIQLLSEKGVHVAVSQIGTYKKKINKMEK